MLLLLVCGENLFASALQLVVFLDLCTYVGCCRVACIAVPCKCVFAGATCVLDYYTKYCKYALIVVPLCCHVVLQ